MQSAEGLGNTFGRSWDLLSSNWVMVVPGIVIGVVAAFIAFFVAGATIASGVGLASMGAGGAGLGAAMMGGLLLAVIMMVATILTIAYTTGMAGAAWRTGRASLDDGAAAFRKDGGSILVAVVLLFILGVVAAFLSIFTFGLAYVAFMIFFLYVFASVIVGGNNGSAALGDSAKLAARNFWMTLAIVVLLCILFALSAWISSLFNGIPLLGKIIGVLIQELAIVYATLVIVGEYIKLRAPVAAAVPPSAGPPATY